MNRIIILMCILGLGRSAGAQQASYFYGDQEIFLAPDSKTVAAVLHPSVSLEKYPDVAKMFRSLSSSAIGRDMSILVSNESAQSESASRALAPAVVTKEVTRIPVYKLANLRLILQNELIVQFKPTISEEDAKDLLRKFSSLSVEIHPKSGTYLVRVGNPESTLSISKILRGNKAVAFSEPNFLVIEPSAARQPQWIAPESMTSLVGPTAASASPNYPSDPLFARQWGLSNRIQDSGFGKSGSDIEILNAWSVTRGSDQVRVAVLDEGVDISHPDLKNSIAVSNNTFVQWDSILDLDHQKPSGTDSHGTRVAGVIAAQLNNGIGIVGVAPNVKIIPIRMGSSADSPEGTWTTPAIADNAIRKAVELHADVINISWFMEPSQLVTDSITYAETAGRGGKGIVFVCADGDDGGQVVYPASLAAPYSGLPVIAVGASNSWDEVKTHSSKDREDKWASNQGPAVTVVAPGVGIVTTDLPNIASGAGGAYIFTFNGTSSAAPFVSGVAALILSIHSDWAATQVRDKITSSADRLGSSRNDSAGWGRLNACKAVDANNCR